MLAKCSHCGGEIHTETDEVFISCSYCKATVFVFSKNSGLRYILKSNIDNQKTELIIKNFFLKNGYSGEISITEKDFVLFPFFKIAKQATLIPSVEGTYHNLLSSFEFKGGELIFFDELKTQGFRVLEPELEPEDINEKEVNLIYYPLVFVSYKYLENEYRLIIDGVTEEVLTDILPIKRDSFREKTYIYLFIITSFLLFVEFIAFQSFAISLILSIVTLLIIWFIFPYVFKLIEDINVSENQNSKMS